MLDYVLRGGTVIDGTGAPACMVDVGVADGKIAFVGKRECTASVELDARGAIIAPGFIDVHSHSDLLVLAGCESPKIGQGVTTEVVGNCGFSVFPVDRHTREDWVAYAEPVLGCAAAGWGWVSLEEYFRLVDSSRPPVNVGSLVGHSAIRAAAMGCCGRPPTACELAGMIQYAEQAMGDGALGISVGLTYPPGAYATSDELAAIGSVLRGGRGVYVFHLRGGKLRASVREAVELGSRSGCRIHISHLKAIGDGEWREIGSVLEFIQEARRNGVNVSFDIYPYLPGCGPLYGLFPLSLFECGPRAAMERMRCEGCRGAVIGEVARCWEESLLGRTGWDAVRVSWVRSEERQSIIGRTIQDLADEWGCSAPEAALRLLVEEQLQVLIINEQPGDVGVMDALVRDPWCMVGSDSLHLGGLVHPRTWGAFAKFLQVFVRERRVLTWEEALRRLSGLPAEVFGIAQRGFIKEGYAADLVVFDPGAIGTVMQGHEERPVGVKWVFINGRLSHGSVPAGASVSSGRFVESARVGRVVRRGEALR